VFHKSDSNEIEKNSLALSCVRHSVACTVYLLINESEQGMYVWWIKVLLWWSRTLRKAG